MTYIPGGGGGGGNIATSGDVALSNPATGEVLTFDASVSKWKNAAATSGNSTSVESTVKTASYTLALTDAGSAVEFDTAGAVTLTVPANSSVAFPVGTIIEVAQIGAGQVTIAGETGVTLRTASSLTTRVQYSVAGIRKRATDEWIVSGDLT